MAMERRRRWLLGLIALLCLIAVSSAAELLVNHENKPVYNHILATILVEYASAVYVSDLTELFTWTCERCGDLTKEFEVIELIVDVVHCLQCGHMLGLQRILMLLLLHLEVPCSTAYRTGLKTYTGNNLI